MSDRISGLLIVIHLSHVVIFIGEMDHTRINII